MQKIIVMIMKVVQQILKKGTGNSPNSSNNAWPATLMLLTICLSIAPVAKILSPDICSINGDNSHNGDNSVYKICSEEVLIENTYTSIENIDGSIYKINQSVNNFIESFKENNGISIQKPYESQLLLDILNIKEPIQWDDYTEHLEKPRESGETFDTKPPSHGHNIIPALPLPIQQTHHPSHSLTVEDSSPINTQSTENSINLFPLILVLLSVGDKDIDSLQPVGNGNNSFSVPASENNASDFPSIHVPFDMAVSPPSPPSPPTGVPEPLSILGALAAAGGLLVMRHK